MPGIIVLIFANDRVRISFTWFNGIVYHSNKLSHDFFCCSSDSHFASCENIKHALRAVPTDVLSLLLQRFISEVQALGVWENRLITWMMKRGVVLPLLVDKERLIWLRNPYSWNKKVRYFWEVVRRKKRHLTTFCIFVSFRSCCLVAFV